MYTIKNISNKVINIGSTALMPDQTMKASEAVCQIPAIKAFVKRRLLKLTALDGPEVHKAPTMTDEDTQSKAADSGNETAGSVMDTAPSEDAAPSEDSAPTEDVKPKGTKRTTKKAAEGAEK